MSDGMKQLVLLLWICAGLIAILGLVSLAAAVSPTGNSGWLFIAFAVYHGAGFMLCFFHVLNSELYGFDKRLNCFWCITNFMLLMLFVLGMLGNVLWYGGALGLMPRPDVPARRPGPTCHILDDSPGFLSNGGSIPSITTP